MKLCAISFKECWQEDDGRWYSYGGFPLQMRAVGSLFDQMTLMVCRGKRRPGGLPLPEFADIVPMRLPTGTDTRRKLSVLARSHYYVPLMARHMRRADVVHVPVPGDLALLGMWVALAMRKKLFARYGGSWHAQNSKTTWVNELTKTCMRRFAGGRNVMVATGDGDAPPANGMKWIFSTALSQQWVESIDAKLDRGLGDPPRLVYLGRLSVEKGVIHLLEALQILRGRSDTPMPHLAVIGNGPERPRLEQFVQTTGLTDQVTFAGQIPHGQLTSYLETADLCVQPSLTEGFSKAWLDAMAFGLPVIASDVGAAAQVIGRQHQRGWLTLPGDSELLAETIHRAITAPNDWSALRQRCRRYVESRTLEAWADRIGELCSQQWQIDYVNGKLREAKQLN